jgi:NAD(P)-dependent dehydrogenase (short-subunit alcohol dehydrogenase family)
MCVSEQLTILATEQSSLRTLNGSLHGINRCVFMPWMNPMQGFYQFCSEAKQLNCNSLVQDMERVLNTNVHGLITLTRQLVPGMIARNRGHIFNISSVAGHEAYGGGAIYCATKFAVRAFTDALRHDLVSTQVRAHCCCQALVKFSLWFLGVFGSESSITHAWIIQLRLMVAIPSEST